MTFPASCHLREASDSEALALSRNSRAVRRAKVVWWLKEQISPAPAPIGTHSLSPKGIPEDRRAMELQTETGL